MNQRATIEDIVMVCAVGVIDSKVLHDIKRRDRRDRAQQQANRWSPWRCRDRLRLGVGAIGVRPAAAEAAIRGRRGQIAARRRKVRSREWQGVGKAAAARDEVLISDKRMRPSRRRSARRPSG